MHSTRRSRRRTSLCLSLAFALSRSSAVALALSRSKKTSIARAGVALRGPATRWTHHRPAHVSCTAHVGADRQPPSVALSLSRSLSLALSRSKKTSIARAGVALRGPATRWTQHRPPDVSCTAYVKADGEPSSVSLSRSRSLPLSRSRPPQAALHLGGTPALDCPPE